MKDVYILILCSVIMIVLESGRAATAEGWYDRCDRLQDVWGAGAGDSRCCRWHAIK